MCTGVRKAVKLKAVRIMDWSANHWPVVLNVPAREDIGISVFKLVILYVEANCSAWSNHFQDMLCEIWIGWNWIAWLLPSPACYVYLQQNQGSQFAVIVHVNHPMSTCKSGTNWSCNARNLHLWCSDRHGSVFSELMSGVGASELLAGICAVITLKVSQQVRDRS